MLAIRSLTAAYGDRVALNDLSLDVPSGGIMAVIGPNGAGKSTLIKAISGVITPRHGEILLGGHDLSAMSGSARARYVSVVPQGGYLPRSFTVLQTVLIGRTPYLGWLGRPQPADLQAAQDALAETGMQDFQDRIVGELSGGEQQRTLLARALAQDTPVLLLDEPTAHLDLRYQYGFLHLVRTLARQKQLAVMMVVHDLNHASMFADRAALLVDGEIRAEGRTEEVLTEEILSAGFGVAVAVTSRTGSGKPVILPVSPPVERFDP